MMTERAACNQWPTLGQVWMALVPFAVFAMTVRATISPHDFWWHVRTGQIILETHIVPTTDLFTYTRAGEPWLNQAWLMQVWLYLLYRAGGPPFVLFVHALTITAGYIAVMQAARLACGDRRAAALGTLGGAAIGFFGWAVRPQAISFVMFGTLVWLLEAHRRGKHRAAWALPVLFALWANLHGAFFFGFILVGVYIISQWLVLLAARRRPGRAEWELVACAALSVFAISLTPAGPLGMWGYLTGFLQSETTQMRNAEFAPMMIRTQYGAVFFGVVLIFCAIGYIRRVRLPLDRLLVLVVFGLLSLYWVRASSWFGMAAAPSLAIILARPNPQPRPGRPVNAVLLVLLFVLLLTMLPWARGMIPPPLGRTTYYDASSTPVAASRALCELPGSPRVFNEIAFGSYLEWDCPTVQVFMDTRFELYPNAMWDDYVQISIGRYDFETLLAKYGVDTIVASKSVQPNLISAARDSANWQTYFEDNSSLIFRRIR